MSGLIKCFNTECRDFSRWRVDHCSRPLTRITECPEGNVRREGAESSRLKAEGEEKRVESSKLKAERQAQKDKLWYIRELKGNECTCGKTKKPGHAFCYTCFTLLPYTYRMATYQRMGDGYEEAYEDAVEWLRNNEQ